MEKTLNAFFKFLHLPTQFYFVVFGAGTTVLLFKSYLNKNFGTQQFFSKFGAWIFLVSVLSFFVMLANLYGSYREKKESKKTMKGLETFVRNLDDEKMAVMNHIYSGDGHVAYLPIANSSVITLEQSGVIFRLLNEQVVYGDYNKAKIMYGIQPWAEKIYLEED